MSPMPVTMRKGLMVVLSSPSGAGKSTIARRLLAEEAGFTLSVSATTRAPRPGDVDGKDYFFVDHEEFKRLVSTDALLEHAEVFGNCYGTPRQPVEEALAAGRDVLFDVDWKGSQQLGQSDLNAALVTIFLLPPSIAELERRLHSRAQDSEEVIRGRMAKSLDEISHWAEYQYVLINDDLEFCYSQVRTIINAERQRRERQPALQHHVATLNSEFGARFGGK
ncbi:MAG: guanylate kinase [Pseudomonadota bacterium]